MTRTYDLTNGSLSGHLLRLAAPLMIGNILQQLYNTVDAFILGHFAGETEFAAIGIAGSVMNLLLFMISGVCTGIAVIFAQFYGAGDQSSFRREHWLSLTSGLLMAIILGLLSFFILPVLLHIIHTPDNLYTFVTAYLHIILIALPATFLYNLYSAMLRAIGRSSTSLIALATAVTINLITDYLFVARFGWGITGAAWATACSQLISAIVCMLYLYQDAPSLVFTRADCSLDRTLLRKTVSFGLITGLHQSSLYIGKLLVQGAVNTGGVDMILAYTATTRIEGFANSFGDSGCSATSVLTAQNLGAGKKERVQQTFHSSLFIMLLLGIVLSVIMYISAGASVSLMLNASGGAAFENACSYMRLIAVFYTLCFIGNTFAGYFDGIGRVSIPFIGSSCHIALRVLLSWILIRKMGLPAVALATGLGWLFVNIFWAKKSRMILFKSSGI